MGDTLENFKKATNALLKKEKAAADITKQKMFVYFDESGNIKCISPVVDQQQETVSQATKLPLKDVYKFITGEISPTRYLVKKKKGTANKYEIVKRRYEISHVRKLDRFLTEIIPGYGKKTGLEIIADMQSNTLTFKLADNVRNEFLETIDDLSLASISGMRVLKFYCTTKNDPSYLIESFTVSVTALLQGNVYIEFKSDLAKYSLFTRQVFDNYSYKITKE